MKNIKIVMITLKRTLTLFPNKAQKETMKVGLSKIFEFFKHL